MKRRLSQHELVGRFAPHVFIVDDIINGIFGMAQEAIALGKPNPAVGGNLDAGPVQGPGNYASFAQATGAEPPNYVEQRPDSKLTAQTLEGMKETTPAASIGGAPVNAGQQLASQLKQPGLFDAGQIGAPQAQAAAPQAQPVDAPMPGALAGQAADQRAFEDAQSAQLGGAAMDTALGLGQDIYSMSQQLGKPGPTGSIQMPKVPGGNPRLSALLGQLYRG